MAEAFQEAVDLIKGKAAVSRAVFDGLLPELRARAFTITGIESANVLQRARDIVAGLGEDGARWNDVKEELLGEISPYFGTDEEAERRSELLLRVHGFQAMGAANWRTVQAEEDFTHLQYIHGAADVPTPEHLALDGLILPKDDPFWRDHYGPWGHPGCVCTARGLNPDQVAEEVAADEQRAPDSKLVMTGPAQRKLNEGHLVRDGRAYDVSAPEGPEAYRWHPEDLRIPVEKLRERYDEEVWGVFERWARATEVEEGLTVWEWLQNSKIQSPNSK